MRCVKPPQAGPALLSRPAQRDRHGHHRSRLLVVARFSVAPLPGGQQGTVAALRQLGGCGGEVALVIQQGERRELRVGLASGER